MGIVPTDARIVERPEFKLVGHTARVPLVHEGANPKIQAHIASLPISEHDRLKELGNTERARLPQIASNLETDYTEGSELTYLHGVRVLDRSVPEDLYAITVPAGTWAVFRTSGPYPAALQEVWASTAKQWFPSNPWMLREGPSMVAVLERAEDFSTATCELWLPMERGL